MPSPFTIPRSRCSIVSDPGLRAEIRAQTGSDDATSSVLRSLERFGGDISIRYFEVTPKAAHRAIRGRPAVAWSVRAVRP